MKFLTFNPNRSVLFLSLFFVSCFGTLILIRYGNEASNIFIRLLRFLFLLFFYMTSVRTINRFVIIILILFFATSVFFVFDTSSIGGVILVCLSRLFMIKKTLSNINLQTIQWGALSIVFMLFMILGGVVLFLFYSNSTFFNIAVLTAVLLVFCLALSYVNLLNTTKKGNLELFIAFSLFAISDIISGAQRFSEIDALFIIIGSVFYNLSYYFLVKSEIRLNSFIFNKRSDN